VFRYPTGSTRDQRASIIERALLSNLETWQVKRRVKEEILLEGGTGEYRGIAQVVSLLESTGLDMRIKNLIYDAHRAAMLAPPAPPEGVPASKAYAADRLDFIERAKLKWERRIRQELDAMAAELGVPLQVRALPPTHSRSAHASTRVEAHACLGAVRVAAAAERGAAEARAGGSGDPFCVRRQ